MLEDLTVKDFALIDSDYLEFSKGFTVFSGETGAGKSILIGALSFLLGGKAEVSQIRSGKSEATVSGTFLLKAEPVRENISEDEEPLNASEWLFIHGIQPDNNRVLLRRFIRDSGKTGSWINDTPVTKAELADFSSFLVDIHGQHEHQSLMKVSEHRKYLDARAGIVDEVQKFTGLYSSLVSKRNALAQYSLSDSERLRKLDMMSFAIKEIEELKLKKNEDEELESEEARLLSYEKLFSDVQSVNGALENSENSILALLKKALRDSSRICDNDKSVSNLNERLESAFYELSDISSEFQNYERNLVFDPQRLSEIQERLSVINNLKKKYAASVNSSLNEVFAYYEEAKKFVEDNSNGNDQKSVLENEVRVLEKQVLTLADSISKKRKETASVLNSEVDSILKNLGMNGTHFEVSLKEKESSDAIQKCGPYGKDDIEFLISANPGNPLLPLAKIASGGELSRVMLALKTIFARNDGVETLIFDEIDTGIGGEVAVAVGKHLQNLAKNRQIFCITHLASIAVYADNQIKIEKSVTGEITSSNVFVVEGEDRVTEIARMLSGDSDTQQSLEHARTLLAKYSGGM